MGARLAGDRIEQGRWPVIIGTAGHIDHGKTSLVKALTGQDTDRLKEEKERGISIDLGFAHFDVPGGPKVGVVDVPGHERFIRNMLAGAHGMDLVLFTVAADDGVMPQTEEHLDILHFLGVEQAIFVITKADRANAARRREVEEEIRMLTEGTALAHSPILPFSFVTGEGLPEVRDTIIQRLRNHQRRRSQGYFRLPVDRAFAMQGHGLVVTGTAVSGEVRVGDRVRSLPKGDVFRVRGVQVHDEQLAVAAHGQRVALNLSGHERDAIERGDVICHESLTLTSSRFDAFVDVRPSAAAGVKSYQRVRVHAGTSERMGKLVVLGADDKIGPKQAAYCQIVLSEPVHVLRDDRFVIRDETAQRTLAGGVVIHPWPRKHRKTEAGLQRQLRALHRGDLAEVMETYIADSHDFAVPSGELSQFLNLRHDEIEERLAHVAAIKAFPFEDERLYSTEQRLRELGDDAVRTLGDYHSSHPLAAGMDMEELRVNLRYRVVPRLFRVLVEDLAVHKGLVRDGSLLRLPAHHARLGDREQALAQTIVALLSTDPLAPPDVKQIETRTGSARSTVMEVLGVMERQRTLVRVSPELYFLADTVAGVKSTIHECLLEKNELTPAGFRDLFGTSRKYTIPLLEYLDREGFTIRVGDVRRLKGQAGTKP
jgi:selenocysteine-specific elongation factor